MGNTHSHCTPPTKEIKFTSFDPKTETLSAHKIISNPAMLMSSEKILSLTIN